MDKQNLIAALKEKFQQGKSKTEIHNELLTQGWKEQDIEDAITSIQHEALKKIPGFSHFFRWYDDPKLHARLNTPRMVAFILASCVVVVFLIVWTTYLYLASGQSDVQREADLEVLRSALGHYYALHNRYPNALENLTPKILQTIPRDPSSGKEYDYVILDNGRNFQLCITFEDKFVPCIHGSPLTEISPGDQDQP